MSDDVTINPITALLRSQPGLPVTLAEVLAHLCEVVEDGGDYATILGAANLSRSPLRFDIEMVEGIRAPRMQAYAEERLGGQAIVSPVVLAGLYNVLVAAKGDPETYGRFFTWEVVVARALRAALRLPFDGSGMPATLVSGYWNLYEAVQRVHPLNRRGSLSRDELIDDFVKLAGGNADSLRSKLTVVPIEGVQHLRDLTAQYAKAVDEWNDPRGDDGTIGATAAAELARVSKMTVLRWSEDDPGLGVKVGGRWRFSRQAILRKMAGR